MEKPETIEMHALFSGRVQGVGFRATVQLFALEQGLKGFVCNLSDGTVEIYAQGTQKSLEELLLRIKGRFNQSTISLLEYTGPSQIFDSFQIIM